MKHRGFSRIEALLAISVTGVAAVMLLPALAQEQDAMREQEIERLTDCQYNLRQISFGLRHYVQDYDEKFPPPTVGGAGWAMLLEAYTKPRVFLQCPSEKYPTGSQPFERGYSDYWLNRNLGAVSETAVSRSTIVLGDGDGGDALSNSSYSISSLPNSWITTEGSPARRHLGGANYAFADGRVKWYLPSSIESGGFNSPTFKIK